MPKTNKGLPNSKLRQYREERGWTQAYVADALGATPLTVGRWERGEVVPTPYYARKLAELFGETPEALELYQRARSPEFVAAEEIDEQPSPVVVAHPQAEITKRYRSRFAVIGGASVICMVLLIFGVFNWQRAMNSPVVIATPTLVPTTAPIGDPTLAPSQSAEITCSATRANEKAWTESAPFGYVGPTHTGSAACDGSFSYILSPTSLTAAFFPDKKLPAFAKSVDVWVYIPTKNAGAMTTYTLKFNDPSRVNKSWTIDQNNCSYWIFFGNVRIPSGATSLTVVASSHDARRLYMAEDAAALDFHSAIPTVSPTPSVARQCK